MVGARSQDIRLTPVVVSIKVSSNQTGGLEVLPSRSWESSGTTESAGAAARGQILGRDSGLDGLSGSDTDSVGHGFDGAESPTRSAVGLVSNFLDGLAFWPGLGRFEGFRSLFEFNDVFDIWEVGLLGQESSHEGLDLGLGHVQESFWGNGSPASVD